MGEISFDLFKRALLETQLEKWRDIPAENEIAIELSEEFRKKGRALIRQVKQTEIKKMRSAVRRMILIATSLVVLAITAFAIDTVQEENVHLLASNKGTYYEFTFDDEILASAPKRIEKVYKPTYIPKGYREDGIVAEEWVVYKWEGEAGKTVTFGQYILSNESVRPQPDAEGSSAEQFILNGYQVLCVFRDDIRMYFWTDNVYFYRLISSSTISKEECDKVFCSIQENKNVIIPK